MNVQQATAESAVAAGAVEERNKLNLQSETSTKLRGRWLVLARTAWLTVAAFSVGLFVVSIPASYYLRTDLKSLAGLGNAETITAELRQLGLSLNAYATYNVTLEVAFAVVCIAIGSIIFWRKSDDVMALLMAFFLVTFGVGAPNTVDAHAKVYPEWAWLSALSFILLIAFIFPAFFTFPDGRFMPRWTGWVALFCVVVEVFLGVLPSSIFDSNELYELIYFSIFAATIASLALVQVYRYRRVSNPIQRQQTKWVVFGITIGIGGYIGVYLLIGAFSDHRLTGELVRSTASTLFLLFIPISIGIAILRNRLFGIDFIIRRTLVYVPLTAILAGLYAASIALSQRVFVAITGEKSDAAIVLTTLLLTTSFTPIKNALQAFVDKRFKDSPDSVKELSAYREQVQTFIQMSDGEQMATRLLEKARQAFNAQGGAVYLERDGELQLVHTIGESTGRDARMSIPLESNGKSIGRLELGVRRNGSDYTAEDLQVVRASAEAVAEAIWRAERSRRHLVSGEWTAAAPKGKAQL